jgi:predicted nucleic acid-binding protein
VTYILDASAAIAYLRGEPGADVVAAILSDPTHECLVHALNMCEVYYNFCRVSGETAADDAMRDLLALGVRLRDDLSVEFWKAVALLKARGGVSLADCFAITLAKSAGGPVLTSDHHEFDSIARSGICPVTFIR